ncbi:tetratricopeptide repeat protein [Thalassobaculum sp.]|uniref:tetratricopeptide repeat protein n=1 Tax=Thalassobaculum sp. TaxID=2022740 RepID=UPI0032EAC585
MAARLSLSIFTIVFTVALICSDLRADQKDGRLPALFSRLAEADTKPVAARLESQIWGIWLEPPAAPDVTDTLRRGLSAMALSQLTDALRAFDAIVVKAPEFAEGWNKRATIRYILGDYEGSIADIQRTLALEPRHFGALSGLGLVRLALDRPADALQAFEAALVIHPFIVDPENIKALREQVRGRPL